MNRVIREVFPTAGQGILINVHQIHHIQQPSPLCSPKKTSLNFLRGLLKSADADMITELEDIITERTVLETHLKETTPFPN